MLVLMAIGYRHLADFSPISPVNENRLDPIEGQLFVPNQKTPLLIFALAGFFLASRISRLRSCIGRSAAAAWGVPILLTAILLNVWAYYTSEPSLALVSLSLTLIGAAALLGGSQAVRLIRLPALFILLALPIPGFLLNSIIHSMQLFTAQTSGVLLSILGVEHLVLADLIYTPWNVFQVIEGCSGLRSIETLVMAAIVYQHSLPHSRACSWLLVISAPLVGLLINQLRVLWIIFFPSSSVSAVHTAQGLIMIVVGILLIDRLNALLVRWLPADDTSGRDPKNGIPAPTPWPVGSFAFVSGLLLVSALATLADPWEANRPLHKNPARFPGQIADWKVEARPIDQEFFGSTRHTQAISRTYRRGDEAVNVFIGTDSRSDGLVSGMSPKNAQLQPGWERIHSEPISLGAQGARAVASIHEGLTGKEYVLYWEQGTDGFALEATRAILAIDRSPWQRPYGAMSFRFSTPIETTDPGAIKEAHGRIAPFVALATKVFPNPRAREITRRSTGDGPVKVR